MIWRNNRHRSKAAAVVTKKANNATLRELSKNRENAHGGDNRIREVAGRVSRKMMDSQIVKSLSFPCLLIILILLNIASTSSKSVLTPTYLASAPCTTLKYYPVQVLDSYDTYNDIRINQIDTRYEMIIGVGKALVGTIVYPAVFS